MNAVSSLRCITVIKMYVYDPTRFGAYKDSWVAAADSSIAHLASQPSSRPDLTFLAFFEQTGNATQLIYESQHCKPLSVYLIRPFSL